jgi:hypothetical protein
VVVLRWVVSWLGVVWVAAGGVVVGCACVDGSWVMGAGVLGLVWANTSPAPITVNAATEVVRSLVVFMMVVLWKTAQGRSANTAEKNGWNSD